MEVTVKLLENAMRTALKDERSSEGWADGKGRFLIDGFPRKMDQALKFEQEVHCLHGTHDSSCPLMQFARSACHLWCSSFQQQKT
jgi:hypothetical protein